MNEIKLELNNILKAFKSHKDLLYHNFKLQRVLNDDLLGVLEEEAMKFSSAQARRDNKDMAISLNYLIKIIEHQSQIYTFSVERTANNSQKLMEQYHDLLNIDTHLHNSNKAFNGSKSVIVEIYQDRLNNLKIRPITNDKFFVYSSDIIEPNRPTHFIKIIGQHTIGEGATAKEETLLHIYTDNRFMSVYTDGTIVEDSENKFGVAPFVYVTKEPYALMPTPARDTLNVLVRLCMLLTDAVVHIFYQGHPVRILKNVDKETSKINLNPDSFVFLNAKEGSDLTPELTELVASLDITQTLDLYERLLNHLLHINGVAPKDASTTASGVALQLKDNDIVENRKSQIEQWRPADQELWEKIAKCHNAIIDKKIAGAKTPTGKFSNDFSVKVEYQLPDTNAEVIKETEEVEEVVNTADKKPTEEK